MDLKKKRNLFHLIEWIVAIVAAAAYAGLECFHCSKQTYENQLIDATIYGILLVSTILFLALAVDEALPEKTLYGISGSAFILYAITAILLLLHNNGFEDIGIRTIFTAIFCTANAIIYGIEFFWSILKKGALD